MNQARPNILSQAIFQATGMQLNLVPNPATCGAPTCRRIEQVNGLIEFHLFVARVLQFLICLAKALCRSTA